MKIDLQNSKKQITRVTLEEFKPSIKTEFNQAHNHLDVYDRGQIWLKYIDKEKRGKK